MYNFILNPKYLFDNENAFAEAGMLPAKRNKTPERMSHRSGAIGGNRGTTGLFSRFDRDARLVGD
ncbi:hypothetical protein JCM12214_31250 [Geobacillus vulcani]